MIMTPLVKLQNDVHDLSPRISDVTEIVQRPPSTVRRIDYLASQIRELGTGNSPQQVLRLGELVYRELHSASPSTAERDHRASLRRIAAHPDVPFKVTTIWRAVSVYEMSLRLPHLMQGSVLGISHLRAVIGLDPADQELLLTLAARERWTKRHLEQEAARRRSGDRRRGRRPLPKLTLWTRDLGRLLDRADELGDDRLAVSEAAHAEVTSTLERFERRAAQLRARLQIVSTPAFESSEDDDAEGSDDVTTAVMTMLPPPLSAG